MCQGENRRDREADFLAEMSMDFEPRLTVGQRQVCQNLPETERSKRLKN